jgi:hypothetical protein
VAAENTLPPGLSLIRKPFTTATLLHALGEVLGAGRPDRG